MDNPKNTHKPESSLILKPSFLLTEHLFYNDAPKLFDFKAPKLNREINSFEEIVNAL